MARLVRTVYLTDPQTHLAVRLDPGAEPEEHLARLITNPAAWEDGQVPVAEEAAPPPNPNPVISEVIEPGDEPGDEPEAKRPARRRTKTSE
jgi:hypothetical protein